MAKVLIHPEDRSSDRTLFAVTPATLESIVIAASKGYSLEGVLDDLYRDNTDILEVRDD